MDIMSAILLWLSMLVTMAPPPPTAEINALIQQLGDDNFAKREAASKNLLKHGHKMIRGCMEAEKNKDLEISRRASRILQEYFTVTSEIPSIWSLPNKNRFPYGVKIVKDDGMPKPENNMLDGAGWCKEMETPFDLGVYYFALARSKYNARLTKEQIKNNFTISENLWKHEEIEKEAMRLFIYDLLYYGRNKKDVKKMLNESVGFLTSHKNLCRHYNGNMDNTIPGPLVPATEVPDNAQYRFGSYPHSP